MSHKYKSSSQKWKILFLQQGKVKKMSLKGITSLNEGKMDQISNNQVMIVGVDAHFLYLMQRYVRRSAYKIISANLGDDLLALARCQKPIAIVLEVDHPETIGWQVLRALKADPEVRKIPVMVCSWLDEEDRGLAEGADIYLRMPILYSDFGATLASITMAEQNE
jgi:response regulator RpfG family c-di-GMP phosphodiesterase